MKRRTLNVTQRAKPMVCAPDSTTRSFKSRPFEVNLAVLFSRDALGDGSCSKTDFLLAVKPSLRPSGRFQDGPPT